MPGRLAPHRVDARVSVADVLPTLLEAADLPAVQGQVVDGVSRWDVAKARR